MHARLRGPLFTKPDCPSSADEIAEPRPDMNIKVAAFTVSENPFIPVPTPYQYQNVP